MINKWFIILTIIYIGLTRFITHAKTEYNRGTKCNIKDTTSMLESKVWSYELKDSVYYYAPKNHTESVSKIKLTLDSMVMTNDTTLLMNMTIQNVSEHSVCFTKLYHTNYDIEAQILSIISIKDYSAPSSYVVELDICNNKTLFSHAHHSGFTVNNVSDIIILKSKECYSFMYELQAKNIKKFVELSEYIQISIDYEYGITSLIPLNNVVFDYAVSNLYKVKE